MSYIGDFSKNASVRRCFNTRAMATIGGSPAIVCYRDGNATEITTGLTLTVDFDDRTGFHLIVVDTSVAAFVGGSDYRIVFSAGTVGSDSLAGVEVFSFSLENRRTETIPWNSDWNEEVQSECADALAAYDPPTNAEFEARTLVAASYATAAGVSAVETDTQDIQSRLPAALVGGRIDVHVGAMGTNTVTAAALATDAVTEIQSGLATSTLLTTVAGYLDTEIASIIAVTNKLDTAMELDGLVWRFTVNALEQAPSGGGGGGGVTLAQLRREVERVNGIRDWGVVGDAPLIVPGTGDNNLATWPSVVRIGSNFHCFYSAGNGSIRHVTLGTDGRTVGPTRTTVVTPGTGAVEDAFVYAPIVQIEGTTLKMWYTGQNSTFVRSSIFYATASTADPLTWTKQGLVVPHSAPPAWVRGCPGACGVKKVGSTYYLYGTTDLTASAIDAANVTPKNYSDRRAWVATSANGTSGWTFYPVLGNTDDESYVDEYLHLVSTTSFSYTINGELRHYLLAGKRGAGSDYQQVTLFESCDPLFPRNATEELGTVLWCRPAGETFPTSEIDIYSVVTSDINGFVPGEFLMYFGGRSKDAAESRWCIGLSSQPNVLQAIRPPHRSQHDLRPNLLRELTARAEDGSLIIAGSSSINVLPLNAAVQSRVRGTTIDVFIGETVSVSVLLTDAAGNAVDLTGRTLRIVLESAHSPLDKTVIENGAIARSGSTITFAVSGGPTPTRRNWSLRDVAGDVVLAYGLVNTVYAAKRD
jgi:hypothetical protein